MAFEAVEELVGKKRTLEILSVVDEEGILNYSDIENRVETSSDVVSNRLDMLVSYELLERIEKSKRNVRYSVTPRGERFLGKIAELEEFLRSENDYS